MAEASFEGEEADPASSLSLSQCGELLAAGDCAGTVVLWNVPEWKLLRQFEECHDLPVTGIAARPYPVPLQGEDGIAVHVRTASADSTMTRLTLQTRVPKPPPAWDPSHQSACYRISSLLHRLLQLAVVTILIVRPMGQRAGLHCALPRRTTFTSTSSALRQWTQCVWDHAILAPATRPGVARPPY